MAPDSDKPWSRERARDIRETFAAIIGKAGELSVDSLSPGICSTGSRF